MNELPLAFDKYKSISSQCFKAGEVVHLAAAINTFLDLGYELIRTIFYRLSFDI